MAIGYKEQSSASVPTPPAGQQYTFIDSADGKVKRKDSTGSVSLVEAAGGALASSIVFTPSGGLSSIDVQAAIVELDTEKLTAAHKGAGGVSEHPVADGSTAGFMSPSDKTKLDTVTAGATPNSSDAFLLARANHVGNQTASTISDFSTAADARITAQKGVASGLATLDGSSKIPIAQIPATVIGGLNYQGTWDASTNSPTLASGVGTKGFYYKVNATGSTALDGITDWKINDVAVYNGATWDKIDNTDQVTSVAGKQGTVLLDTGDVSEASNLYFTTSRAQTAAVQNSLSISTVIAPSATAVNAGLALKVDKAGDTMSGQLVTPSVKNSGTAGAGFYEAIPQSSDPVTPASGFRLFAESTGKFAWKGTNGFKRTFDGTANTADRVYTLPDASGPILTDPSTTTGDLLYKSGGVLTRLPIGTEDYLLRSVGGIPMWQEENLTQDFGDGSDGNLTVSGALTLTQIPYYNVLTIAAGAVLNPGGYPIYCKTLDLTNAPAGSIIRNGPSGTSVAANAGGAAGTGLTAAVLGGSGSGGAGAAGATNAGVQGGAGVATNPGNGGNGGNSGASGAGGTGALAAAAAGATATNNVHYGRFEYQFLRGASLVSGGAGGRGGNSGGGDGANSSRGGGGGGAGGGVITIYAAEIITGVSTPSGVIQCKGGNGGNQTNPPAAGNVGGAGGSGGGGGGYCYITYVKKTGATVTSLIDCSGGTGGNGSAGLGTGIGGNGGVGGNGGYIQTYDVTNGTGVQTVGSAGSAGTVGSGVTPGTGGNGGNCVFSL